MWTSIIDSSDIAYIYINISINNIFGMLFPWMKTESSNTSVLSAASADRKRKSVASADHSQQNPPFFFFKGPSS